MRRRSVAATTCLQVDGADVRVPGGSSVAVAIAYAGAVTRRSVSGRPRAPLCGMGICFECRASVDGVGQRRTCMIPVADGMVVVTDG